MGFGQRGGGNYWPKSVDLYSICSMTFLIFNLIRTDVKSSLLIFIIISIGCVWETHYPVFFRAFNTLLCLTPKINHYINFGVLEIYKDDFWSSTKIR